MLKEYKTGQIRNVAIIGHGGTGKSTLLDAMLFACGKISKMGNAGSGTLVSDFDEDEKNKQISIRSTMGFVEIDDVKINILDTPGTADFIGESRAALQAVEAAILVVDSVDGVQIETEKAWRYLSENNIPRIIFVNKMDKERANYENILTNLKTGLNANIASLSMSCGEGEQLTGIIDISEMKMMTPKGEGPDVTIADISDDMKGDAESAREQLVEFAAEGNDELIEKFFEEENLSNEEIVEGIAFFNRLLEEQGELPLIAEDLGVITPEVEKLRDDLELPGMKILQFAFDFDNKNFYLPHNITDQNCILYTGTHDNNTTNGWFYGSEVDENKRNYILEYTGAENFQDMNWKLIRQAFRSIADTVIIPAQDILGYSSEFRMNTPGTIEKNWAWKLMDGSITEEMVQKLRRMGEIYDRVREKE